MWCRVLNSNGFKFSPTLTFIFIYFCFMQSTINHWGSPSRSIYYQYWCYWSLLRNPIVTSVFFFLVVVYYLITSKQWCAEILANEDIQPKRRKPLIFVFSRNVFGGQKSFSKQEAIITSPMMFWPCHGLFYAHDVDELQLVNSSVDALHRDQIL